MAHAEAHKNDIRLSMTILYVKDQALSSIFYKNVLGMEPVLDVPGMTEFLLPNGTSIGLMPERGIKKLLGDRLPDPALGSNIPRVELYFFVSEPEKFHNKVLAAGGREVSPLADQMWGDNVAYSLDLDGHVLAFARKI
jgi:catechol 2,3-dioxygenase-like lactoylglutathione lyase family enzyme